MKRTAGPSSPTPLGPSGTGLSTITVQRSAMGRWFLSTPPLGGEENGEELLNLIPDTVDHTEELEIRAASRREIQEFSQKLAQFGLTLSDVADNCPRQDRTFAACRRVLDFARGQPELLQRVENTGKLPMNELVEGTGVERKTLERHRKYLAAILLAFTNGYEIIRGHLCQVAPKRGDGQA